jgi:hypothetical protein
LNGDLGLFKNRSNSQQQQLLSKDCTTNRAFEISVTKIDGGSELHADDESAASDDFVAMNKRKIRQKPNLSIANRNQ